jgi:hypothetical protein
MKSIRLLLKGKGWKDYTIEELEKKAFYHKALFYGYALAGIAVMVIGSYTIYNIFDSLMAINTEGSSKLLLLLGMFGIINFFLLFWVWLTSESSYYKMEQEFTELMVYLRSKEFEDQGMIENES